MLLEAFPGSFRGASGRRLWYLEPMTARTLAAWLALATLVGCGGRTTSEPAPDGPPAQPQPPCGMILDPAWSFQCQARLDRACCAEQRACAASPDCMAVLRCVSDIPRPRSEDALERCAHVSVEGLRQLLASAECEKSSAIPYPPGDTCEWPTGD